MLAFFIPTVIIMPTITYSAGQCAFQTACSPTTVGRAVKFNALERIDHLLIPVL